MSDTFGDILNEDDEEIVETPEPSTATAGEDIAAVVESPAPEQTETSEPALVADEAQPITRDDGATWSENAKRWYLNGKIVSGEPPAAPSEASIPSVPPVVPVVEPPKVEAPAGEPFVVRGGGQKHTIPGATVDAEGRVTIAPEMVPQIKALFAAGIEHNTNWQREKQTFAQQIQQAEARGKANADKYNKAAVFVFDKVNDPNWLQELVSDPERALGYLRKDLGYLLKEADLNAPRVEAQPEPQAADIETAFQQTVIASLDELLDEAPKGLFTAEDVADLRATYTRRMTAYAAEHGGEIVLDFHALRDDFAREVKLAQKAQAQTIAAREQAKKAQAAAAFNAANTPKTPATTPKRPNPTLVPAGTKPSGTKRSWEQSVKDAWADDGDDE